MLEFGEFLIGDIILAAMLYIFGIWCGWAWHSDRQSDAISKEIRAWRKKTAEFADSIDECIARSEYFDRQEGNK